MTTTTLEIESVESDDGIVIKKISFVQNGQRWTAPAMPAAIYQQEDSGWWVGWDGGAAGPFERRFAQAVARKMAV
jgi:hypothetical protein